MNRHHQTRPWPRNESPAARVLVLIEWILRHQMGICAAVMGATVIAAKVLA